MEVVVKWCFHCTHLAVTNKAKALWEQLLGLHSMIDLIYNILTFIYNYYN